MTESINALSARGLRKRFAAKGASGEVAALDGIDFDVPTGSLAAVVGPDGAGKTTLLRLAAGLYGGYEGQLTVLGLDVGRQAQAVQNRISYMPQRFGLYEDLSVQENLDLYSDLHGIPRKERASRYARLMAMTQLGRFTSRPAGKLSGGMKQKLGLACSLVRSPALLLLDEPTVGVDPLSRRELWAIVQQLVREEHLTVIVTTAYLDEAERCDQVLVLHSGQFLALGSPASVREHANGLCFTAQPREGDTPRALQARLMDVEEAILDAVPQAGLVRFVRRSEGASQQVRALLNAEASPVTPRLEDGFMVLMRSRLADDAAEVIEAVPASGAGAGAEGSTAIIEVRDLVRRFGSFTAVDSTSFTVQRGEIFGLLGPNGAGKTTTFRMLCGLLPATSGFLRVAGVDLRHARARARQRIGYVSQKFALYGNLTVAENLAFFGSAYGLHGTRLRNRVASMLLQFGLFGQEHRASGQLPGGYKRRLAMACALLHEPDILFLDEPTSGADPLARRQFWRRITALAQAGVTVIVTTHFMEEAEYCDRILIQDAGKVLALGTPREVRQQAAGAGTFVSMEDAFISIVEQGRRSAAEAGA